MGNEIFKDIVSNGIVIFVVWAISSSLKNYIKTTVADSLGVLAVKIDRLEKTADSNGSEIADMKKKLANLKSDLDKLERTIKTIGLKVGKLNCAKEGIHCENAH